MSLNIDRDWEQVSAGLGELADLSVRQLLTELGALQVGNIRARVRNGGLGTDDQPFPPSKKLQSYGGTSLVGGDTGGRIRSGGNMLAAMQSGPATDTGVEIKFVSPAENKKALWAQDGTRAHDIYAKPGKVLAWRSSLSSANSIINTRGGVKKARRLTMANARANGQGMVLASHVHHPGTPPREFFGVSPKDEESLMAHTERFVIEAKKRAGL